MLRIISSRTNLYFMGRSLGDRGWVRTSSFALKRRTKEGCRLGKKEFGTAMNWYKTICIQHMKVVALDGTWQEAFTYPLLFYSSIPNHTQHIGAETYPSMDVRPTWTGTPSKNRFARDRPIEVRWTGNSSTDGASTIWPWRYCIYSVLTECADEICLSIDYWCSRKQIKCSCWTLALGKWTRNVIIMGEVGNLAFKFFV